MKKIFGFAAIVTMLGVCATASAHERQAFHIGSRDYLFIVGSLNEPAYVDDKSGVDLRVMLADPKNPGDSASTNAKPVEGLEKTLKVEVSAGDKKKVFDLAPAYKNPGAYTAPFYPTVQTGFSYRFFGTIDNVPVDLTFSCNSAGHSMPMPDNTNVIKVSDSASRIFQAGAFGCPLGKADAGFPEPSASIHDVANSSGSSTNTNGWYGTISIAALALSVVALVKKNKK